MLPLLPACASPPGGFDSPVPALRLRAISQAAATGDRTAIPDLISMLQSDDPAVRMLSIRTLERLTGTTLGYDYAAPQWQRDERIAAWVQWYKERPDAAQVLERGARTENSPSRGSNMPISGVSA